MVPQKIGGVRGAALTGDKVHVRRRSAVELGSVGQCAESSEHPQFKAWLEDVARRRRRRMEGGVSQSKITFRKTARAQGQERKHICRGSLKKGQARTA